MQLVPALQTRLKRRISGIAELTRPCPGNEPDRGPMNSTFRLRFRGAGLSDLPASCASREGARAEQKRSRPEARIPRHWRRAQGACSDANHGKGAAPHVETSRPSARNRPSHPRCRGRIARHGSIATRQPFKLSHVRQPIEPPSSRTCGSRPAAQSRSPPASVPQYGGAVCFVVVSSYRPRHGMRARRIATC